MSTPPTNNTHQSNNSIQRQELLASKWMSIALIALIAVLLGRVWDNTGSQALAEMAIMDHGYTMMTTNAGNDEILILIDTREEMVSVYRSTMTNRDGLALLEKESLATMFARARAQHTGQP